MRQYPTYNGRDVGKRIVDKGSNRRYKERDLQNRNDHGNQPDWYNNSRYLENRHTSKQYQEDRRVHFDRKSPKLNYIGGDDRFGAYPKLDEGFVERYQEDYYDYNEPNEGFVEDYEEYYTQEETQLSQYLEDLEVGNINNQERFYEKLDQTT